MIIDSYNTSAASAFDMSNVENELRRHLLMNQPGDPESQIQKVAIIDDNPRNVKCNVFRVVPGDDRISPFSHPHLININAKEKGIFIDVRSFTRTTRNTYEVIISDATQYNLLLDRAILQLATLDQGDEVLLNLGTYPIVVYANWLAENIGRRVGADLDSQSNIAIIAALYYYSQFVENDLDEGEKLNLSRICSEIVPTRSSDILDLIDLVGKLNTLDEFIQAIANHSGSTRLQDMKVSTLYTYVASSWFGMNRIELMGVTLEHLPTFITLAFYALTTRNYRNTELSKIALRYERSPNAKAFVRSFLSLKERYIIDKV